MVVAHCVALEPLPDILHVLVVRVRDALVCQFAEERFLRREICFGESLPRIHVLVGVDALPHEELVLSQGLRDLERLLWRCFHEGFQALEEEREAVYEPEASERERDVFLHVVRNAPYFNIPPSPSFEIPCIR